MPQTSRPGGPLLQPQAKRSFFFPPHPVAQHVGLAERFGHSIRSACLQHHRDRTLDIDSEPRRNIDRFCSRPGPQDGSNTTSIDRECLPVSSPRSNRLVGADEPSLGTPNGWAIEQKPHMRGKPQVPWMGDALTLEDPYIRLAPYLLDRLEKNGTFPEAEKPRYIGKTNVAYLPGFIHNDQLRKGEHHHRPEKPVARPGIGHVGTADPADSPLPWDKRHLRAEAGLNLDRLTGADVPWMKGLHDRPQT